MEKVKQYLQMPGTWAGLVAAIGGIISARYGHPVGELVTQLLLVGGGVLIGAPK